MSSNNEAEFINTDEANTSSSSASDTENLTHDEEDSVNSPDFMGQEDLETPPAFREQEDLETSPAFREQEDLENSPAFREQEDLENSPDFREQEDLENSPDFREQEDLAIADAGLKGRQLCERQGHTKVCRPAQEVSTKKTETCEQWQSRSAVNVVPTSYKKSQRTTRMQRSSHQSSGRPVKIRVSKSCTKECDVIRPDYKHKKPSDAEICYYSFYEEVLNEEGFTSFQGVREEPSANAGESHGDDRAESSEEIIQSVQVENAIVHCAQDEFDKLQGQMPGKSEEYEILTDETDSDGSTDEMSEEKSVISDRVCFVSTSETIISPRMSTLPESMQVYCSKETEDSDVPKALSVTESECSVHPKSEIVLDTSDGETAVSSEEHTHNDSADVETSTVEEQDFTCDPSSIEDSITLFAKQGNDSTGADNSVDPLDMETRKTKVTTDNEGFKSDLYENTAETVFLKPDESDLSTDGSPPLKQSIKFFDVLKEKFEVRQKKQLTFDDENCRSPKNTDTENVSNGSKEFDPARIDACKAQGDVTHDDELDDVKTKVAMAESLDTNHCALSQHDHERLINSKKGDATEKNAQRLIEKTIDGSEEIDNASEWNEGINISEEADANTSKAIPQDSSDVELYHKTCQIRELMSNTVIEPQEEAHTSSNSSEQVADGKTLEQAGGEAIAQVDADTIDQTDAEITKHTPEHRPSQKIKRKTSKTFRKKPSKSRKKINVPQRTNSNSDLAKKKALTSLTFMMQNVHVEYADFYAALKENKIMVKKGRKKPTKNRTRILPEFTVECNEEENEIHHEDITKKEPMFPIGKEVPPDWVPGSHGSHPLTQMSTEFQTGINSRRRIGSFKKLRSSRSPRKHKTRVATEETAENSDSDCDAAQLPYDNESSKQGGSECSTDLMEGAGGELGLRCLVNEEVWRTEEFDRHFENMDFDSKREFYERKLHEEKAHAGDCLESTQRSIGADVGLLKTIDDLYNNTQSSMREAEWSESDNDSLRSFSDFHIDDEGLSKSYLMMSPSPKPLVPTNEHKQSAVNVRIQRMSKIVPSIIDKQRVESLTTWQPYPEVNTDTKVSMWDYVSEYNSPSEDDNGQTEWKNTIKKKVTLDQFGNKRITRKKDGKKEQLSKNSELSKGSVSSSVFVPIHRCFSDGCKTPRRPEGSRFNNHSIRLNKVTSQKRSTHADLKKDTRTNQAQKPLWYLEQQKRAPKQPPEPSMEEEWCYTVNEMLLRGDKALNEQMQSDNRFPRPNSAKKVTPIVHRDPQSKSFLSELLKQDDIERKVRFQEEMAQRAISAKAELNRMKNKSGSTKKSNLKARNIKMSLPKVDEGDSSVSSSISAGVLRIHHELSQAAQRRAQLVQKKIAMGAFSNYQFNIPQDNIYQTHLRIGRPMERATLSFNNDLSPSSDFFRKREGYNRSAYEDRSKSVSKTLSSSYSGPSSSKFLLDQHSDTFRYYNMSPQHTLKKHAIQQLYSDSSNNNNNNNNNNKNATGSCLSENDSNGESGFEASYQGGLELCFENTMEEEDFINSETRLCTTDSFGAQKMPCVLSDENEDNVSTVYVPMYAADSVKLEENTKESISPARGIHLDVSGPTTGKVTPHDESTLDKNYYTSSIRNPKGNVTELSVEKNSEILLLNSENQRNSSNQNYDNVCLSNPIHDSGIKKELSERNGQKKNVDINQWESCSILNFTANNLGPVQQMSNQFGVMKNFRYYHKTNPESTMTSPKDEIHPAGRTLNVRGTSIVTFRKLITPNKCLIWKQLKIPNSKSNSPENPTMATKRRDRVNREVSAFAEIFKHFRGGSWRTVEGKDCTSEGKQDVTDNMPSPSWGEVFEKISRNHVDLSAVDANIRTHTQTHTKAVLKAKTEQRKSKYQGTAKSSHTGKNTKTSKKNHLTGSSNSAVTVKKKAEFQGWDVLPDNTEMEAARLGAKSQFVDPPCKHQSHDPQSDRELGCQHQSQIDSHHNRATQCLEQGDGITSSQCSSESTESTNQLARTQSDHLDFLEGLCKSPFSRPWPKERERLRDTLVSIAKTQTFAVSFRFEMKEDVKITPIILDVFDCTDWGTQQSSTKTEAVGAFHTLPVFYTCDGSGMPKRMFTLQPITCGVYSLEDYNVTNANDDPGDDHLNCPRTTYKAIRPAYLVHYPFDSIHLALSRDKVFLFRDGFSQKKDAVASIHEIMASTESMGLVECLQFIINADANSLNHQAGVWENLARWIQDDANFPKDFKVPCPSPSLPPLKSSTTTKTQSLSQDRKTSSAQRDEVLDSSSTVCGSTLKKTSLSGDKKFSHAQSTNQTKTSFQDKKNSKSRSGVKSSSQRIDNDQNFNYDQIKLENKSDESFSETSLPSVECGDGSIQSKQLSKNIQTDLQSMLQLNHAKNVKEIKRKYASPYGRPGKNSIQIRQKYFKRKSTSLSDSDKDSEPKDEFKYSLLLEPYKNRSYMTGKNPNKLMAFRELSEYWKALQDKRHLRGQGDQLVPSATTKLAAESGDCASTESPSISGTGEGTDSKRLVKVDGEEIKKLWDIVYSPSVSKLTHPVQI